MSEYFFGSYRPEKALPVRWHYWFVGPNRGDPFNSELRDAVLGDLKRQGIEWGQG